ncbi:hypothetical protein [Novisyntrophococcus fermenticellae]|uniref:hypothetical protein n=1 Tax=Novisyntrophococcus fermenticellae TaxID=2068655 RepID=UPI001E53A665|nr:hypothetical protein [Novisyntrophococcus fermenticellae]
MHVYKELSFVGNKPGLDNLAKNIYTVFPVNWIKPKSNQMLKDYILADYVGNQAPHAEVSIYYGKDTWRDGYVKVCNIVPLQKNQLTIEEYNQLLDLFYNDIAKVYGQTHDDIKVVGPSSGQFNPLDYISDAALKKLTLFCNATNKSTGSSHPCDEERWFDFICQTVDDGRVFDYDTLFKFLQDEEYWGKKENGFLGVIGQFAWSEENAEELASEYDNYVRILQYYKNTRLGE